MPFIHLRTRRLDYQFEITQKYNLLIGDSGTGKTTLYHLISAFAKNDAVAENCGYSKIITDEKLTIDDLATMEGYVIFFDEDSQLLHQKDTASLLEKSKNYFVIISRDVTLGYKSVSLDCVFSLKSSGKYHTFEKVYSVPKEMFCVDAIICEDSGSGFEFIRDNFEQLCKVSVAGAEMSGKTGGKAKIAVCLNNYQGSNVCIVFDKSAIAYQYPAILESIRRNKIHACFIDWDSFETYILQSKIFNIQVPDPEYKFESKEQLATEMIKQYISYSKSNLCKCLKRNGCSECNEINCPYTHFGCSDLIYWKVRDLYCSYDKLSDCLIDTMPERMITD